MLTVTAAPGAVTLGSISTAADLLDDVTLQTPLWRSDYYSRLTGVETYLFWENLQLTGSFKVRGAYVAMSALKARGSNLAIVVSAGNHAQGAAYAAKRLGMRAIIFMPVGTPEVKQAGTKRYGGEQVEIVLAGANFDEALKAAEQYCADQGLDPTKHFVHPFDNYDVIRGQGTVALDLATRWLEVGPSGVNPGTLIGAAGGLGLMSGVATTAGEFWPACRCIAGEPSGAASWAAARRAGMVVELPLEGYDSTVDGAATRRIGQLPFELAMAAGLESAVVAEALVEAAVADISRQYGRAYTAELAGALPLAVLWQLTRDPRTAAELRRRGPVVLIISGGNIDFKRLQHLKATYPRLKDLVPAA